MHALAFNYSVGMISDSLSFDSDDLTTLAAVVTKDLRDLMAHVTPKLRDGLITPLKQETALLETEFTLMRRVTSQIADEASESVSLALKENLEISKVLTEAMGKKTSAVVGEMISAAVNAALRRELEVHLLPVFSEALNSSSLAKQTDLVKDLEILSRRLEGLENTAQRVNSAAEAQRRATEKISREIEITNFQEIIDEVVKPLLQGNIRGLFESGEFDAAVSLAQNSPAALDEFLALESPESWTDKISSSAAKRSFALIIARSLTDPISPDSALVRIEWVFELILSLNSSERPGNFFEELGEQLSLVDTRGDKKLASKVAQSLRLVRSLQW